MDLISREKAIVQLSHNKTGNDDSDVVIQHDIATVQCVPSAFEGMTNGDVMKAIFPDCIDYHGIIEVKTHLDMGKTFRRSWWDSPYKGQDGLI